MGSVAHSLHLIGRWLSCRISTPGSDVNAGVMFVDDKEW